MQPKDNRFVLSFQIISQWNGILNKIFPGKTWVVKIKRWCIWAAEPSTGLEPSALLLPWEQSLPLTLTHTGLEFPDLHGHSNRTTGQQEHPNPPTARVATSQPPKGDPLATSGENH